jgi:hypothetical protein
VDKGTLKTVIEVYAYANGFIVLAKSLDAFRLGIIVTGGKVNPPGNLFFVERYLVGWLYGS